MTQNNHAQILASTPTQPSRIAQLAALQAQVSAIRNAPGYHLARRSAELDRLYREISALEGSFVLYEGEELDAELVNEMDGHLNLAVTETMTLDAEGHERLYRTPGGDYFIRRKLAVLDVDGENERRASGRTFVHRLSVCAAAQWAIMRANAYTTALRRDLWEELQDLARLRDEEAHTLDLDNCPALASYPEGHPLYRPSRYRAAPSSEEDDERPLEILDLRGIEGAAARSDVALCAAASVAPPPPTGAKPIRDVLHDLAAGWLSQAVEARQQSADFVAIPASGKLAVQADLLENCAAAVLRAIEGKEGR